MCKYGVLDVIYLLYADSIWGFYYAYIEIGYLRTFLGGHREALVDPCKEFFEEVDYEVVT